MPGPTRSKLYRLADLQKRVMTGRFSLEVLDVALDYAIELVNAERGFIVVPVERDDATTFDIRSARNFGGKGVSASDRLVSTTLVREALAKNETIVTDPLGDPRFSKSKTLQNLVLRTVIVIPLSAHGGTVGALVLHEKNRAAPFDAEDGKVAELVALPTAVALETLLVDACVAAHVEREPDAKRRYKWLVGSAPAMERLYDELETVCRASQTVLIFGETGTGKELVARTIHEESPRANGPYKIASMAAIPDSLAESMLFGHEKGSFTGADRANPGLFRSAHKGTIFLDEVGELSPNLQAKLLRVLQEGEVLPLGATKAIKVDVRVIAATHRDLAKLVADGLFRQDLYYRLNVLSVTTPPLRERRSDIPALAAHFLAVSAADEHVKTPVLGDDALAVLTAYDWPGNVRELGNAMCQAVAKRHHKSVAESEPVRPGHFKLLAARDRIEVPLRAFKDVTREQALAALKQAGDNRTEAARLLDISRSTLYAKLKQLGIA